MVNALGERSFCSKVLPIFTSTSKWTQSHLLLLQLQNCIYSFLPRKIQNWVLKRGWGFSKAAFQRTPTTQTSLLIPFTEEEEVQKIAKPEEKKFSDSGWRYNFCNLAQTKCQHQRFIMLEKSKAKPNLELQRLNSILVALILYVYSISVKCELTIPWGPTDR